jgi:DNA repair exonuclease SbcCD ATPase subunit
MQLRVDRLERSQESIARSLEALVRLEQHHADTRSGLERAWQAIETDRERMGEIEDRIPKNLDDRLQAIEREMPSLKETSRWVKLGVLAVVGMAGTLVWSTITEQKDAARQSVQAAPAPKQ